MERSPVRIKSNNKKYLLFYFWCELDRNFISIYRIFNFDNISLGQPTVIQGGSYFTKISSNSNILYLQTPSRYTKQGIVLSGKKAYCDLMYTSDDYDILTWFERLVERLQQLIYDKRKLWFHNEMEMEDIDNAFTPPIRTYKSGKYYLLRTYIQKTQVAGRIFFDVIPRR